MIAVQPYIDRFQNLLDVKKDLGLEIISSRFTSVELKSIIYLLGELKAVRESDSVREVILCKDCKHWGMEIEYKDGTKEIACRNGWSSDPDGYCFRAKRKDGAQ